jgi:hypothetical protein
MILRASVSRLQAWRGPLALVPDWFEIFRQDFPIAYEDDQSLLLVRRNPTPTGR